MKPKLLFLCLLFALLVPSVVFAFKNEPDGINKYRWGTPIKDVRKGNRLVSEAEKMFMMTPKEVDIYAALPEDRSFLGFKMNGFNYMFWQDRLFAVTAGTSDEKAWKRLMAKCKKLYGKPQELKKGTNIFVYRGTKTALVLAYNPMLSIGMVNMFSVDTSREIMMKAMQDQAAKNGGAVQ